MVGGQEVDGACVSLSNADDPSRRLLSRPSVGRDVHMDNIGANFFELIVVVDTCTESPRPQQCW